MAESVFPPQVRLPPEMHAMPTPEPLSDLDFHQTTVQAFIAQLQARAWNRPVTVKKDVREGETLDDWELFN